MASTDRPQMTPLEKGRVFKTMEVRAKAGQKMPEHHTTREAVITVKEGEALLKLKEGDKVLKRGDSVILPAYKKHGLEVKQDFKAVVIMSNDGEIEF